MKERLPVILDVDAGVDDLLAIIFALLSPSLDVKAITTVCGNVPVSDCTRNVLVLLELLIPHIRKTPLIAEGEAKPLIEELFTAPEVHGKDGMGNASRRYGKAHLQSVRRPAVETIVHIVRAEPALRIIATGPLTNIARAITRAPKEMNRVREIIVMGGGFDGVHNTGPIAEFNFYVDPQAAEIVLQSGIPIKLIPLNVTHECRLTPEDLRRLPRTPLRNYIEQITAFYFSFHRRTLNFTGGYLHDPLAVSAAVVPGFFRFEKGYVHVEHQALYTRGQSIFYPTLNPKREAQLPLWVLNSLRLKPTIHVAREVDSTKVKKEFLRTLRQFPLVR